MATCTTERFIGQGKVFVAPRASGGSINDAWLELGDTELLTVNVAQSFVDDYESCSGNRSIALHVPIQTDWEFNVEAKSFSKENLARAFYGTGQSVAGASVATEIVTVFAVGSIVPLLHPNVTNVVVDAAGGTPTLIVVDDYSVDAVNGTITFTTAGLAKLTGSPATAEIDYDFTTHELIEANVDTISEYAFRFEGINLTTKLGVIVSIPRVSLNLTDTISWIGTEVNRFPMTGMMLPDPDAGVGESQYMRIVKSV